uniref:Uncharacterized protein n=1 Tax=Solanum tuberosum TaxID=4113 RepID=M0ZKS4_SOLTU
MKCKWKTVFQLTLPPFDPSCLLQGTLLSRVHTSDSRLHELSSIRQKFPGTSSM